MTRLIPLALAALVTLVLVAPAGVAWGSPKLALPAIHGDDDGDLREAVLDALDGPELTLITETKVNRAFDKLGKVDGVLSEKKAKQLATELKADAVIYCTYEPLEGKSKLLRFKLWVNGRKLKGFSVQFTNARSKKFKKALYEKMVEKVNSPPPDDDDDADQVASDKKRKGGDGEDGEDGGDDGDGEDDDEGTKKKRKKTAKLDEDGEDDEDGDGDDDDAAIVKRAGPVHSANRVAIRLDVGAGTSARKLSFTSTPELGEDAPPTFDQGAIPTGRVEVEAYPIAFANPNSFAAGLGVGVKYDRALISNVTVIDEAKKIKVKQQQYTVGARYRLAFGGSATSPTLTAGVNYGRRTFVPNRGGLMDPASLDLPDTDYKYLAPLLGLRIPLGQVFALVAGGEAILVRDAGPIQEADSYGRAKIFGFDSHAGFDIVLKNRFAIRVIGEYNRIGFAFTGRGDLANNRDGDPETIDIGGALDSTFGGSLTLAVLY